MRVLLRGSVPGDVVEVMVERGFRELGDVADHGLEVTFGRRDEVGVVH